MTKKPVDFVSAMQTFESREGVQRRSTPTLVPAPEPAYASVHTSRVAQRSRVGKVSIGVWIDPAVRKQLAQIALDTDMDQADLIVEGLNLVFERYGKPPIAKVG